MNKNIYILGFAFLSITFIACEDTITVDSGFETPQLVVDAWIENVEGSEQTIAVTWTQDYFDNRLPTPIEDAIVTVSNGNKTFDFVYNEDGTYQFQLEEGEAFGEIGDVISLSVIHDGKEYNSSTQIYRTAVIDSIRFYIEDGAFGSDSGTYAEVYAKDPAGFGDSYWIRTFKNDTLLTRPQEINLAYDAAFNEGTNLDGTYFISPIRFAVNPLDDDGIPTDWKLGDKIRVEVHSISNAAFRFMQTVQEQATNGDNSIFALPVANARSNISLAGNPDERILGFFNVASVAAAEKTVTE